MPWDTMTPVHFVGSNGKRQHMIVDMEIAAEFVHMQAEIKVLRQALDTILMRSGIEDLPDDAVSPGMLIVGKIAQAALQGEI